VHAVDVLVRVHGQQRRVVVQVTRHRVLDQQRVHRRVVVELGDRGVQVGLGGVGRQVRVRRHESQLGGLLLLDPDVPGAGVVVADQDGGQGRLNAALAQGVGAAGHIGQHGPGDGRAGKVKSGVGTGGSRHAGTPRGHPGGRPPRRAPRWCSPSSVPPVA
jgi:hypothetical protein